MKKNCFRSCVFSLILAGCSLGLFACDDDNDVEFAESPDVVAASCAILGKGFDADKMECVAPSYESCAAVNRAFNAEYNACDDVEFAESPDVVAASCAILGKGFDADKVECVAPSFESCAAVNRAFNAEYNVCDIDMTCDLVKEKCYEAQDGYDPVTCSCVKASTESCAAMGMHFIKESDNLFYCFCNLKTEIVDEDGQCRCNEAKGYYKSKNKLNHEDVCLPKDMVDKE